MRISNLTKVKVWSNFNIDLKMYFLSYFSFNETIKTSLKIYGRIIRKAINQISPFAQIQFTMKTLFMVFAFAAIANTTYGQGSNNGMVTPTELPGVVIKSAGKDFSVYLPDKHPDARVTAMEDKFIGYNLGKDHEGYDSYLVILTSDNGILTARYNQNGKLINVVERYTDVRLPNNIIYAIYKEFPDWRIKSDKYDFHQSEGEVTKKEYVIKLKKDNETKRLIVGADGTILKGKF